MGLMALKKITWKICSGGALLIIILLGSQFLFLSNASTPTTRTPIKHIVILMQENRTLENFFWTYPGIVNGSSQDPTLCMPKSLTKNLGCAKPTYTSDPLSNHGDLTHDWNTSWLSYDYGKMDGFMAADGGNPDIMTYYNATLLPYIWNFARNYTLADEFFSSVKSYSQPNHWFMIAGQSPQVSLLQKEGVERSYCVNSNFQLTLSTCTYINAAQKITTMAQLLSQHGISWKYYDTPRNTGINLDQSIINSAKFVSTYQDPFDYFNPLNAINQSYTNNSISSNIVARYQFFSDVKNGNLPAVSWIIPSVSISDHPPANITLGEWWIDDVVSSIMQSQYWKNTMIVILWDDYGGFFSTLAPPTYPDNEGLSKAAGLGFRAPALIISPYSKSGYIDNSVYDFESTLAFIEHNWNLPPLTIRDTYDVNHMSNLHNALNFSQTKLKAHFIPLTASQLATITPYIYNQCQCIPPAVGIMIGTSGLSSVTFAQLAYAQSASSNLTSFFVGGDPD